MPIWAYNTSPYTLALIMVVFVEIISLFGLWLFRRYVVNWFEYHDGINDAVSGTVQAIGVFYGITVGLIAVGVWNSWSGASDLVAREAAAIGTLYRDFASFPDPLKSQLRAGLVDYLHVVIDEEWPAQREGKHGIKAHAILNDLQDRLMAHEPSTEGEKIRYSETLAAYNRMLGQRRLRIDAVDGGLSNIMWFVIWVGACISIGVAYLFYIRDWKLHAVLIFLMAGFLAMVLFLIVVNDKPFYGTVSIQADSYQLILDQYVGLVR